MNSKTRLLISGLSVVVLLTIGFIGLEDLDNPEPLEIASTNLTTDQIPSIKDMTPGLVRSQDVIDAKIRSKEMKLAGKKLDTPQNPTARAALEMAQRVGDDGTIPDGALMKAKKQFDELEKLLPDKPGKDGGIEVWEWLGPGNIGGRIRAIAIHPTSPNIMYIGGVSGGVWKTDDGGAGWWPLTDFLANLAVTFLVLDPTDPNTIYASTGEGFGNHDALRGAGIFKTTNGGIIWDQLPSTVGPDFHWVNRLAHHPTDSGHLLAAAGSGLWETLDGGVTWTRILTPIQRTQDVRFHPSDPSLILVGTASDAYFSSDGGANFTRITDGVTSALNSPGRCEVAFAPSDLNYFYLAVNTNGGEIWRSTDGGATWVPRHTGSNYMSTQGWYDNALWVRPDDREFLVVGGIDLWRSTDGGASIDKISRWQDYHEGVFSAHADQHIILEHPGFGPGNKLVYVGNDGGIQFALDIDLVDDNFLWGNLANNLGITQFFGGAASPGGEIIVGGTQDNDQLRYFPAGGIQGWYQADSGDGGFAAVNYHNPMVVYKEYIYLHIKKSVDGGTSYFSSVLGLGDAGNDAAALFIAPFVMDPVNPDVLYAGGTSIWRTVDGASFWILLKGPETGSPKCSAIDVAPSNTNVIWVGYKNGVVSMSTDMGGTWTRVDDNPTSIPGRFVTDIAISPHNSDQVVVTVGGYATDTVWYTDDAGVTWTLINGTAPNDLPDIQVNTVRFDPIMENWIYIGTDMGMLATEDLGQNWSVTAWRGENEGPLNTRVSELFWMGEKLVAATHGRGMFVTEPFRNNPPVAICQDVEVEADENCLGHATAEMVDNGSYDPDGDAITLDLAPPGPFDLGETGVTLTVTDEYGAFDSCEAVVHVVDVTPPVMTCPANIEVECTVAGGIPADDPQFTDFFADFMVEDNCDPDPMVVNDAPAIFAGPCEAGGGVTTVTWTATDFSGNEAQCSATVTVVDTTPPEIEVTVAPEVLWPPNHKMVDVTYTVIVSDICDDDVTWVLTSVTSNEPENDGGDGNTDDDIQGDDIGTPDTTVSLRAERSGKLTGRIYTATFTATDCSGNTAETTANVHVPHSRNDAGIILGSGDLPLSSETVSYMVSGASLWPDGIPVDLPSIPDEDGDLRTIDPISGFITNTAGLVNPVALYIRDLDNDRLKDILMSFDRGELMALRSISTPEDGDPVMALEVGEERFMILEMNNIQDTNLDLDTLIDNLNAESTGDDLIVDQPREVVAARPAGIVSTAPNPFNPKTTVSYYLPEGGRVEVVVFDISGRMIARLVDQTVAAGEHSVDWTGVDSRGSKVASGVYFVRMKTGRVVDTQRVIMIK